MKLKRYLSFPIHLIGFVLHLITKIIPRNKKKWVFGSKIFGFADNSKYFFIHVCNSHTNIHPIWIANNKRECYLVREMGYESYIRTSFRGLFHTMTAKVFVSNMSTLDINRALDGGAFYLNLWHGVGIKKIRWCASQYFMNEYNMKSIKQMHNSFIFKVLTFTTLFRKPDLLLVPSKAMAEKIFIPSFEITNKNIIMTGYPRNSLLNQEIHTIMSFIKRYEPALTFNFVNEIQKYKKKYIYMPTWRNDGKDFVSEAKIDWGKLNEILKQNNAILILKLHPRTAIDIKKVCRFENIISYPTGCDVYTILPFTDCLITDYSSIYCDYLLLNKEIILFCYDYKQYIEGSYELLDYDKYYLGRRAYNFDDLIKIINTKIDCHLSKSDRNLLMDFYWGDINNNIDITEEVQKRINIHF